MSTIKKPRTKIKWDFKKTFINPKKAEKRDQREKKMVKTKRKHVMR